METLYIFLLSFGLPLLILLPIMWLIFKAANNQEFNESSVDRIRLIKELEMIESIYDKSRKN